MPDLQSALYARITADAALGSALGDRVHWSAVPQGAALPYVRLQTVSDPRPQHLQGYHASRRVRVQMDVFAATYATAREISEKIIALVSTPATVAGVKFGRVSATGPRDLGEDTPKGFIHRLSTDLLAEHSIA